MRTTRNGGERFVWFRWTDNAEFQEFPATERIYDDPTTYPPARRKHAVTDSDRTPATLEMVAMPTASAPRVRVKLEIPQLRLIGACRKKVGDRNGGDLLLFILCRVNNKIVRDEQLSGHFEATGIWIPLYRSSVMSNLGISLDQYKGAIDAMKASYLIEWRHDGGRAKAYVRLSPEGEEWALSEGLLPDQTTT